MCECGRVSDEWVGTQMYTRQTDGRRSGDDGIGLLGDGMDDYL